MKTLLLAFLVGNPLMPPAAPAPGATADNPVPLAAVGQVHGDQGGAQGPAAAIGAPVPDPRTHLPCGTNEVYKATYYYQYPGGPECGLTYQYCYVSSPPRYHEGCTTSYYDEWYADCYCP